MKTKQIIRLVAYYLLPIGLVTYSFGLNPPYDFYVELGEVALNLLLLNMFLKPVVMITRFRLLMPLLRFRRELGVASFWAFLFHAGGLIWLGGLLDPQAYLGFNNLLFWGALAGIGMIILGLTSNDFSVRLFKKHWRVIHWLAYPVLFFSLIHRDLAEGEGLVATIGLGVIYLVLKILEKKKFTLSQLYARFS